MKKALHTAKVACIVLIFNTLCISIFCFLVPILVISRLIENIISILSDCYTALKEENINVINKYKTEEIIENNKTQAHVLGEKLKESVRNN